VAENTGQSFVSTRPSPSTTLPALPVRARRIARRLRRNNDSSAGGRAHPDRSCPPREQICHLLLGVFFVRNNWGGGNWKQNQLGVAKNSYVCRDGACPSPLAVPNSVVGPRRGKPRLYWKLKDIVINNNYSSAGRLRHFRRARGSLSLLRVNDRLGNFHHGRGRFAGSDSAERG